MIVSHSKKIIFIHNHKTGGTSIERWLVEHAGARIEGYQHATARASGLGAPPWAGYYAFGFVRNPWARLFSWWQMFERNPEAWPHHPLWNYAKTVTSFDAFVRECTAYVPETDESFIRPQVDYFTDENGKMLVDFIGRYEHLKKDVESVAVLSGLVARSWGSKRVNIAASLPHLNGGGSENYREAYTDDLRKIVTARFENDIDTFKYVF